VYPKQRGGPQLVARPSPPCRHRHHHRPPKHGTAGALGRSVLRSSTHSPVPCAFTVSKMEDLGSLQQQSKAQEGRATPGEAQRLR